MDQIYVNEGLVESLHRIVNGGVTYRLFDNPVTIAPATLLASLNEATFAGYAPVAVSWIDFPIRGIVGNAGYAQGPPLAFLNTSGGPVTMYGYYATDTGNTLILWAANFDGGSTTIPDGSPLLIPPAVGNFSALTS